MAHRCPHLINSGRIRPRELPTTAHHALCCNLPGTARERGIGLPPIAHCARSPVPWPSAPTCLPTPPQARVALPTCCINWPRRRWKGPVPSPCARIRTWTPPCTSRRRHPRRPRRRRLGKPRFLPWRSAILKTQTSMFVQVFCSPRDGRGLYRKVSVIIHAASWERRPVGAPTGCRFGKP